MNARERSDSTGCTDEMALPVPKGICEMRYNGKLLDSIQAKEKNLSCDRAQLYKNYYTYLYGCLLYTSPSPRD